jgi:predicted Zn-dependent protease
MGKLFYSLGRSLGYASIPVIRKSKWVWQSLVGDEAASLQSELEFGRALAAELRLKTGVSHDPESAQLVAGIVTRLSACVRNKQRTFKGEVLLDPEPTAMALPGGFVFLSSGLLEFCRRDLDEVAFLTGHEMGHVVRGHALERMLKRIGAEGLSRILSRGLLNPALRESGIKWLESSHSREAELEADEFGLRVCSAAGYEAAAALRLFERLTQAPAEQTGTAGYFTSHPPASERMAHAKAILQTVGTR